jgi:predicted DNA-binding transcriptional regulator AlpA
MESTTEDCLLPARKVLIRYDIADRTLDSWLHKKSKSDFPRPVIINRRRYFKLSELQAWEKQRVRGGSAAS